MGLNIRRSSFVSNEQKDPWIFPRMSILSISSNKTDETVFSPRELAKAGGRGGIIFIPRSGIIFSSIYIYIYTSLKYYNYGDNISDEEIFNES